MMNPLIFFMVFFAAVGLTTVIIAIKRKQIDFEQILIIAACLIWEAFTIIMANT